MPRGRKPGIATVKTSKTEKTQGKLAKAIAAKQADKAANPPMVAGAIARTAPVVFPDYTAEVGEIADSLRHIHSTLHILSSALLAWSTRDVAATIVQTITAPVEAPGITPLGEVKPRRGRKAKAEIEKADDEAQGLVAVPGEPVSQMVAEAEHDAAKVEAVPEKPAAKVAVPSFEEMRAAAVALAGKENGRARLTAILQAEAGVANLSGVTDEKRAAVIKALVEAAGG